MQIAAIEITIDYFFDIGPPESVLPRETVIVFLHKGFKIILHAVISMVTNISGTIILGSDIPADFMARSSLFSPRFPKVISEASSVANGRAIGTRPAEAYISNSTITSHSSPLPTKSSMYFHRNCIRSMNMAMKKVITNGPR
ncbi:MAG: hypothetical protein BWX59_01693 [Bacteroidetes bacterium ADurb.Bin028]|nr:MAG: hypothetical protein BWX59_01693 [Bacteroidetes bacterium ADurb.Bin028]